ncbi:hypothetical protein Cgig2_002898 [Carnegiea gigantea]|uniref:Uncharacterized protein n=1 Tax=Carnegiea gigantea TaxID=171969 RepID=A0A9Q1KPZ9_9CARY|nr:hypothetical protein Cgig2_002898 [Carnegiea gigantea]
MGLSARFSRCKSQGLKINRFHEFHTSHKTAGKSPVVPESLLSCTYMRASRAKRKRLDQAEMRLFERLAEARIPMKRHANKPLIFLMATSTVMKQEGQERYVETFLPKKSNSSRTTSSIDRDTIKGITLVRKMPLLNLSYDHFNLTKAFLVPCFHTSRAICTWLEQPVHAYVLPTTSAIEIDVFVVLSKSLIYLDSSSSRAKRVVALWTSCWVHTVEMVIIKKGSVNLGLSYFNPVTLDLRQDPGLENYSCPPPAVFEKGNNVTGLDFSIYIVDNIGQKNREWWFLSICSNFGFLFYCDLETFSTVGLLRILLGNFVRPNSILSY